MESSSGEADEQIHSSIYHSNSLFPDHSNFALFLFLLFWFSSASKRLTDAVVPCS
jgi:hypothetical protein